MGGAVRLGAKRHQLKYLQLIPTTVERISEGLELVRISPGRVGTGLGLVVNGLGLVVNSLGLALNCLE